MPFLPLSLNPYISKTHLSLKSLIPKILICVVAVPLQVIPEVADQMDDSANVISDDNKAVVTVDGTDHQAAHARCVHGFLPPPTPRKQCPCSGRICAYVRDLFLGI